MVCPRFALYDGNVFEDDIDVLCSCGCNAAQPTPFEEEPRFICPTFFYKYHPRSAFTKFLKATAVPTFDVFPKYREHKETLARLQRNWDMVYNHQGIPGEYQDYADYGGDDDEVREAVLFKLQQDAKEWTRADKCWDHSRLVEMSLGWSPLAD